MDYNGRVALGVCVTTKFYTKDFNVINLHALFANDDNHSVFDLT